jgi:uncharacterized SAM-binding protein YcdF (DUF218 family)
MKNNPSHEGTSAESTGGAVGGQSQSPASARPNCKLWGMVTRQPRWGLSWRGRLLVLAATLVLGSVLVLRIHSFLAVTHRVDTNILVVEGWIEGYAIRGGAAEFKNGAYERVFTTGGPIVGDGGYVNDYRTSAGVGADGLKQAGVPADLVQIVASHEIGRDRTYQSAVALRNWFHQHNLPIHSINLLTEDAHGRRSRLLFQMAFGDDVKVGIISVPNPDYDPAHWWRASEGVRQVISESIAYLYARFLFWPSHPDDAGQ